MKTYILFFLAMFQTLISSAQMFEFKALNIDRNFERKVFLGFHEDATIGLDTIDSFIERDFDEAPWPFDLRILQRSKEDFNCLKRGDEEIYFPESFDSWVNIRGVECQSNECFFEIVLEEGYYTTFSLSALDEEIKEGTYPKIGLYNSCGSFIVEFNFESSLTDGVGFPGTMNGDTIRMITMEFGSNDLVSSQSIIQTENLFEVYPNPVTTTLNIKSKIAEAEQFYIEVYNLMGQLQLKETKFWENHSELDIISLPAGLHHLVIKSDDGQTMQVEKILKL